MPSPDTLVGNIIITNKIATINNFIITADIENLAIKKYESEVYNLPLSMKNSFDLVLIDKIRAMYIKKLKVRQEKEFERVLDEFRKGNNPLRDSNGNKIGTTYYSYSEITYRLYNYLINSKDPKDKVVGARLTQQLTDNEIVAITGLDAVGIQDLRNKANIVIQAVSLMKQAGGNF